LDKFDLFIYSFVVNSSKMNKNVDTEISEPGNEGSNLHAVFTDIYDNPGLPAYFNRYSADYVDDMANMWEPMCYDPYLAAMVRHIFLKSLPSKIQKIRELVGSELNQWTGWEWNDAEYAHLFIMTLARTIEYHTESEEDRNNLNQMISLSIGQNTCELYYFSKEQFFSCLDRVYTKLSDYVNYQLFPINHKTLKSEYLTHIKKTVGVTVDGKPDNSNLEWVHNCKGLLK
jgi:hypothetical protein